MKTTSPMNAGHWLGGNPWTPESPTNPGVVSSRNSTEKDSRTLIRGGDGKEKVTLVMSLASPWRVSWGRLAVTGLEVARTEPVPLRTRARSV
ncbi:MAG: hypothetical protein QXT68_04850 [Halobacteria archaeon]